TKPKPHDCSNNGKQQSLAQKKRQHHQTICAYGPERSDFFAPRDYRDRDRVVNQEESDDESYRAERVEIEMKSRDHLFNLAVTRIRARDDKRHGKPARIFSFGFTNR